MVSIPEFLTTAPRHLFFTGKGGVGKTSLACASAVLLADKGRRVLLVSTDPASNLDAVLGTKLANSPTPVAGVPNLQAMNIDSEQATREYRERTVGPYRGILPPQELTLLEERLSGACTVEVAAFDEFALLLSDPDRTQEFDHVIFDTAPTGHTLRLLELPAAWTGFLESAPGDVSCLGPLSGLKTQRERYARTVGALADPKLTAIMLVARPERVALMEAARTSAELRGQAMTNQLLVINGVFHATDRNDPLAAAVERRGAEALSHIPEELASLPRAEIPLIGSNIVGLDALRSLFTPLQRADAGPSGPVALPQGISRFADLVDELSRSDHGLVMVMGKGGVGKTTVAAAVAVSLAKRGMPVHLTTTDPAQHIWETLQSEVAGLRVSYIDPKHEVQQYRERMLELARATLSAEKLGALRGRVEVALLRGSRRVSGLLTHRHGCKEGVGGRRYRANRSYAPPVGHRRRLPSATDAADSCWSRAYPYTSHDAAGSGVHENLDRRLARDDSCARSERTAGRLAPGADRAVRMGHQRQSCSGSTARSGVASPCGCRDSTDTQSQRAACEARCIDSVSSRRTRRRRAPELSCGPRGGAWCRF